MNSVSQSWEKRGNLSIFGVYVVETYNVATWSVDYGDNYHILLCALDKDMINTNINSSWNT